MFCCAKNFLTIKKSSKKKFDRSPPVCYKKAKELAELMELVIKLRGYWKEVALRMPDWPSLIGNCPWFRILMENNRKFRTFLCSRTVARTRFKAHRAVLQSQMIWPRSLHSSSSEEWQRSGKLPFFDVLTQRANKRSQMDWSKLKPEDLYGVQVKSE